MRGRAYIVGNAVGLLPGSLIFSLLGDQAQSLIAMVTSSSQSTGISGTTRRDEIALLGLELVFLVGAAAALGLHFRRVWQRKAEQEAARAPNSHFEERVALLGDIGEVVAEAREEGLGFLGIGDPVDEIIAAGKDYSAIVLGGSTKSTLQRMITSSIPLDLVRRAPNSVMIIR